MKVYAAVSTVTGIDYSLMFAAATTELVKVLPGIVLIGVGVTVAIWSTRLARKVFRSFAR